jgi:uncharacterized YigZ family protein
LSEEIHSYKTIEAASEGQYRVLGSRHLSYAYPVNSEEEIKQLIDQLWKDNHNATHVCYSWRLGFDKTRYRINDDGEPSGTAGKPIFGQIQSFDLTNILIAVVRYYGGTKLGTGGLIDAYKTASKLAIEAATIVVKPVKDHFKVNFSYEQMPNVMKLLKDLDFEKLNATFEDRGEVEFLLAVRAHDSFMKAVEEMNLDMTFLGRR